jgi:biotin transport system substrate-specific component
MERARHASTVPRTLAIRLALALAGSVLLAVSAKIAVPMLPVPITLQTLALPLLVLALGRNLAVTATLAYLAEGAAGLPVFATVPGPAAFLHPSAGYLLMYPLAAYVIGSLLDRGWNATWGARWAAILAGDAIVFAGGVAWLIAVWHIAPAAAVAGGVAPFVIGDLLKISIASALPSQAAKIAARFNV